MSITAKELAQKLGLSQTAVSMALNNKPGVSTETRRMIIEAAENMIMILQNFLLKKIKLAAFTLSAIVLTMLFYPILLFSILWWREWNL